MSADRRQRHEQDRKRPGVLESVRAGGGPLGCGGRGRQFAAARRKHDSAGGAGEDGLDGSAVLFAAAHGSAEAKIYAFAMGLVFGWAVEHTGRIWPGMGLHCLNNCIVLAGCLAERGLG